VIALVRYLFTVLLLSQRYLAPVLLFTGLLAVLTSNDSGPLTATYGSAAGAMLVCSVWLTMALLGLEDRAHRSVVVVTAGGHARALAGWVATAVLACLPPAAAGLVLPLVFGNHSPTPADLLLGLEAQLTCAFTGIGIGLVCSPLVVRRQGYALVLALVLLAAALPARTRSPVGTLLVDLQSTSRAADLLGSTAVLLAAAAGVLAAGAALTYTVAVRK
jgi:hypothetical protein